ncbi:MAG: 4Fe-4S dicluster domain-containing protein, partial [Nitrospinota bacterium]
MLKTEGKPGISRSEFLRSAVGVSLAAGAGAAASAAEAALPWYKAQPPGARPVRWGFLVDVRKCIGCKACTVACKAEFDVRLGVSRASVRELEHGTYPNAKRSFLPWLCNHCENPICLTNCPVEEVEATFTFPNGKKVKYKKRATYQRPDGIV